MVPIFERGAGQGIGYSLETFKSRFSEICAQHSREGRAKAFAFIFYDFDDKVMGTTLQHSGVFTQLDRLSDDQLSIFVIHAPSQDSARAFNLEFIKRLDLTESVTLPCVVFFKMENGELQNIEVAELDKVDATTAFHALYSVIEDYMKFSSAPVHSSWKIVRSAATFISVHVFDAILGNALSHFF